MASCRRSMFGISRFRIDGAVSVGEKILVTLSCTYQPSEGVRVAVSDGRPGGQQFCLAFIDEVAARLQEKKGEGSEQGGEAGSLH